MQNEIFNIIKEAQKALVQLNEGRKYTTAYVYERFFKSAEENPHDILINNMRNVIEKKASAQEFISQSEITVLYDKMIGLGGGNSAFRNELQDLLLENRQFAEPKKTSSDLRADRDGNIKVEAINQELSDAFSVALGFGNNNSFASHTPQQNNLVKKVVIASLAAEGMAPNAVEIISENEHFALVAALYNDGMQKVAIHLPVQISNGTVNPPSYIVSGQETVKLSKDNLWIAIKDAKDNRRHVAQNKFASQRTYGDPVKVAPQTVPSALEKFAQFETSLVSASTMHSSKAVFEAITMVSDELKSFGSFNPQVKIASASNREILLNAYVPTESGTAIIKVPVEIHNEHPNLPNRFASDTLKSDQIYDFSREGYLKFLSDVNGNSRTVKVARQTGNLSTASYHELTEMMLSGVASKDYSLAESAMSTIQDRFDSSQFVAAFDKFTQLLKHSSADQGSDRAKNIEAAVKRGELIKHSTTVELFCPKLGLPLSKIAFDEGGRIIPSRALRSKSVNEEEILISSYDIKFS